MIRAPREFNADDLEALPQNARRFIPDDVQEAIRRYGTVSAALPVLPGGLPGLARFRFLALHAPTPQEAPHHLPSGALWDPLRPWLTEVNARDLFVRLSRQRRYGGDLDWTVLQHLALCSRIAGIMRPKEPLFRAFVVLHDMHEAYTTDLPYPIKRILPEWEAFESAWEQLVHQAVGIGWPVADAIKARIKVVDQRAAFVEMATHDHPDLGKWDTMPAVSPTERRAVATIREASPRVLWGEIERVLSAVGHPIPGAFTGRKVADGGGS